MRTEPTWVLAVFHGGFFGLFMGLFGWLQNVDAVAAAVGGLLAGAIFGAIMGPFSARQRDAALAAAGPLPPAQQSALRRQLLVGRVPQDPEGRAAAARMLRHQQAEARRWQPPGLVLFSLMLVLTAGLALTRSPWWWLGTVFWVGMLVVQLLTPRRIQRRLARLEE